jgi:hypothetical protein
MGKLSDSHDAEVCTLAPRGPVQDKIGSAEETLVAHLEDGDGAISSRADGARRGARKLLRREGDGARRAVALDHCITMTRVDNLRLPNVTLSSLSSDVKIDR